MGDRRVDTERRQRVDERDRAPRESDVFNLDGIRQLVELMKENNVSELDLAQGRSRLRLSRDSARAETVSIVEQPAPVASAPIVAAPVASEPKAPVDDASYIKTIDSPMVGTFYAASNPNAAPFVKVGDVVSPNQTVCMIEAMKVFNDIQAEISGKIVAILVKDGSPVEFGAPLFKVDARG